MLKKLLTMMMASVIILSLCSCQNQNNPNAIDPKTTDISEEEESVLLFDEGLVAIEQNGKWGYINQNGDFVVRPKYDDVDFRFSEDLACVGVGSKYDEKYGYINRNGEEVIPLIYDFASSFSNGLAKVGIDYNYGYINQLGEEVIPLKYQVFDTVFDDGYIVMKTKDDTYDIYTNQGVLIAANVDDIGSYDLNRQ